MLRILIPILIILILIPVAGGYFYFSYFTSLPEVVVPDLQGMPLFRALEELESLNLKGVHTGSLFDLELPAGAVVSQRPEAGRRVKAGRRINLLTSSGKRKVMVPNILGRSVSQAEAVLMAKGLLLGEVSRDFNPKLEEGIILVQEPLPEEEVEAGYLVNITVSSTEEGKRAEEKKESTAEVKGGFRLWW